MTKKYDYLIVGAGLFGAVFSQRVKEAGRRCLILEKRDHIAGNCYTENKNGVQVHQYGPHIFHTNNRTVWNYVNRFGNFNKYHHRVVANYKNELYSFPVNLFTLYQLWGVHSPEEAKKLLEEKRVPSEKKDLKSWILSQVGEEIYKTFIEGYTRKQWGRDPATLPASIIQRIPIRLTHDNSYFNDEFQGIPMEGYTAIVRNMIDEIQVELGVDYLAERARYDKLAKRVVYTGPLDAFCDNSLGRLGYRSLVFQEEEYEGDYQGVSVVNYTDYEVPYTRTVEHKHFLGNPTEKTIVTREFPVNYEEGREPFYPIESVENQRKATQYRRMVRERGKYILGGRLGTYQYYDMHQIIAQALKIADREITRDANA